MDTSQAHLSSKGEKVKDSTKPDNLSKDELTAVLKYGAQKMQVALFPNQTPHSLDIQVRQGRFTTEPEA
jgi:hypothetical protein